MMRNAVKHRKKLRNSLVFNYKSDFGVTGRRFARSGCLLSAGDQEPGG